MKYSIYLIGNLYIAHHTQLEYELSTNLVGKRKLG